MYLQDECREFLTSLKVVLRDVPLGWSVPLASRLLYQEAKGRVVHEHSRVYISHVPHISIVYLFCNILGVQYEINNWCIICHKIWFYNFAQFRDHCSVHNCISHYVIDKCSRFNLQSNTQVKLTSANHKYIEMYKEYDNDQCDTCQSCNW